MNPRAAQSYLRTRVLTASPEQLQLMLYDGAIRFAEQAHGALRNKNWEMSYEMISRSQRIISELTCALKHDVDPELCRRLAGLYSYVYRKLVEANVQHKIDALDDALKVLRYQRQTWILLLEQLTGEKAALGKSIPPSDSDSEASISLQG